MKHLSVHLQQGSYRNFKSVFLAFSDLNDMKTILIKANNLQTIVDNLLLRGLKTSTIKDYLGKLNVIFKAAIEKYNIITINPISNVT